MVKIKELQKGKREKIKGNISVTTKTTKPKQGESKPYLKVVIDDYSEKLYSSVWDNDKLFKTISGFSDGDYVEAEIYVEADMNTNRYFSAKILSIKKLEATGVRNIIDQKILMDELREEYNQIKHGGIHKLLGNIFKREDVKQALFTAPASDRSGYSHEYGILTHIVRIIRLCNKVAEVFNSWTLYTDDCASKLNVDLLKGCAILHDIGKIKAFEFVGNKIQKTVEGELFDTEYLGMKIICEELSKVDFSIEDKLLIEHALMSQRNRFTDEALNIAKTREAIAFHYIEKLDMEMANFEYIERLNTAHTDLVNLNGKSLYMNSFDK